MDIVITDLKTDGSSSVNTKLFDSFLELVTIKREKESHYGTTEKEEHKNFVTQVNGKGKTETLLYLFSVKKWSLIRLWFLLSVMYSAYVFLGSTNHLKIFGAGTDDTELVLQKRLSAGEHIYEKHLQVPDIEVLHDNANLSYFVHYYKEMCNYMRILHNKEEKGLCPCLPNTIEGSMKIELMIPSQDYVISENKMVQEGGTWKPKSCIARQKVAIIIPFRGRDDHLRILLKYLHPMLRRQQLHYQIFVAEQAGEDTFNKGVLMNAGFKEAMKRFEFDCIIFHDVDLVPEDDRSIYSCTKYIRHLTPFIDRYDYILPYYRIFGGALSFKPDQFFQVNGFSSEFSGWGGEDDDMYNRVTYENMDFIRYPRIVCKYKNVPHTGDVLNPKRSVIESLKRVWQQEGNHHRNGLNSLSYTLKDFKYLHLYTWMLFDLSGS